MKYKNVFRSYHLPPTPNPETNVWQWIAKVWATSVLHDMIQQIFNFFYTKDWNSNDLVSKQLEFLYVCLVQEKKETLSLRIPAWLGRGIPWGTSLLLNNKVPSCYDGDIVRLEVKKGKSISVFSLLTTHWISQKFRKET